MNKKRRWQHEINAENIVFCFKIFCEEEKLKNEDVEFLFRSLFSLNSRHSLSCCSPVYMFCLFLSNNLCSVAAQEHQSARFVRCYVCLYDCATVYKARHVRYILTCSRHLYANEIEIRRVVVAAPKLWFVL